MGAIPNGSENTARARLIVNSNNELNTAQLQDYREQYQRSLNRAHPSNVAKETQPLTAIGVAPFGIIAVLDFRRALVKKGSEEAEEGVK